MTRVISHSDLDKSTFNLGKHDLAETLRMARPNTKSKCRYITNVIDHGAGGSQGWTLRGQQLCPIWLFTRRQAPSPAGAQCPSLNFVIPGSVSFSPPASPGHIVARNCRARVSARQPSRSSALPLRSPDRLPWSPRLIAVSSTHHSTHGHSAPLRRPGRSRLSTSAARPGEPASDQPSQAAGSTRVQSTVTPAIRSGVHP